MMQRGHIFSEFCIPFQSIKMKFHTALFLKTEDLYSFKVYHYIMMIDSKMSGYLAILV